MKFSFVPLLPLLLLACVSEEPASSSKPAASEPGNPHSMSKVESPAPKVAAMPPASAPGTSASKTAAPAPTPAPTPAPVTAPETNTTPPQDSKTPVVPTVSTPQASGQPATSHQDPASVTKPPVPPAGGEPAPKPQVPAFQMPTTPPLPVPVVLGPPAKVDPHTLSGKNLGGPIHVFGKTIEEREIRRFLCYGVGSKQLDSMKFDVLCEQELNKRKAAGEDVSQLVVTDAEFNKALEKSRKDFLIKYPSLDFPVEVGRAFLDLEIYKIELRRTMRFDKVFFPHDPATWPAVTTEAIVQASGGRQFIDDSLESYAARKQMMVDQHLDELPPDDPILVDTLRSWLLDSLNQFAVLENDVAKLPADTLMIVEGTPIKVDALWKLIEPHVTWENVADTRRFLTQMAVVEHDLEQRKAVMSQEEFETNFTPNVPFKDALTNYEMVAIVLYGFPSMQADIRYERMLRSYRKVIAEDLATNEKLQPFLQRANLVAGASRIDAEVILSSAYDFPNARWKVDGWKAAETKARDLKQKLDAGADWGETLELYSDYWDPPMPEVGQKPQFGFNFKGRFGLQTRNQFVGDLHESEFTTFLHGKSIADEVFFDQKGGTISDVMPGMRGYYIARINSRAPGSSGLNLQVPQNREYVVNFIAMIRFGVYARQLLTDAIAKGDVTGF